MCLDPCKGTVCVSTQPWPTGWWTLHVLCSIATSLTSTSTQMLSKVLMLASKMCSVCVGTHLGLGVWAPTWSWVCGHPPGLGCVGTHLGLGVWAIQPCYICIFILILPSPIIAIACISAYNISQLHIIVLSAVPNITFHLVGSYRVLKRH